METSIGISEKNRAAVALTLNKLLADEHVLYVKTRAAHWNVEGHDFLTKHQFFEEQYTQIEEIIDNVAERIRSIGHFAEGTLAGFLKLTHLTEETREKNDSNGLMRGLLESHEAIIISIRENINQVAEKSKDIGTSDFITSLMEQHEKMAWMLRAHLSNE
jgi:starvation-inducible DNA-binding protein